MAQEFLPVDGIRRLLALKDLKSAKALLGALHPSDIAKMFGELEESEVVELFKLLDRELASSVILETEGALRELLVSSVSRRELVEIIDEMETDDATDVIAELPVEDAKEVLDRIEVEESIEVQKLLKYREDTAGGKMQTELASVREDLSVGETIAEVRKRAKEIENISSVFVVDEAGRLVGIVALDKLLFAPEGAAIKSIASTNPAKVTTDVDQEEVAKMFQRYDLISMPVVDEAGRLVGRITIDDVMDVVEEEIFEDFYRMASLNLGERALDPPTRSIGLRTPWLLLNLATAFVAASVVKVFESTIESLVILAVLMPIVAGMGGNAATQAITVTVRGLALGDITKKNARRLLTKEILVGLANGAITGVAAITVAYLLGANIMIGLLLFLAMVTNMTIAGISGSVIPLALRWLGADPALASSIFVTTCTDVGGFLSFLGIATIFVKAGIL